MQFDSVCKVACCCCGGKRRISKEPRSLCLGQFYCSIRCDPCTENADASFGGGDRSGKCAVYRYESLHSVMEGMNWNPTAHTLCGNVLKKGVLQKLSVSSQYFKNWRSRVVTLHEHERRVTWQKEGDDVILGQLVVSVVSLDGRGSCDFTLVSLRGERLRLRCSSAREALDWVACFESNFGIGIVEGSLA